jgi:putative SOS response-associated peptidase YedK
MSESPTNIDRIRAWLVATCGMFRLAFERRRCIVPGDALYEWKVDVRERLVG